MVKFNREADLEAVKRLKHDPFTALLDPHLLPDAQKPLGRVLLLNAGGLDQKHKRAGAAVHDGHLIGAQINARIVNAKARQRREQMFNGGDPHIVFGQGGGEAGIADIFRTGGYFNGGVKVNPLKHDPGIGGRRAQGQEDLFARVQAHPGRPDAVF